LDDVDQTPLFDWRHKFSISGLLTLAANLAACFKESKHMQIHFELQPTSPAFIGGCIAAYMFLGLVQCKIMRVMAEKAKKTCTVEDEFGRCNREYVHGETFRDLFGGWDKSEHWAALWLGWPLVTAGGTLYVTLVGLYHSIATPYGWTTSLVKWFVEPAGSKNKNV